MLPCAAFHLGLQCLSKYLFTDQVSRMKRVKHPSGSSMFAKVPVYRSGTDQVSRMKRVKHSIKIKSYQELLFERRSKDTLV